MFSFVEMYLFGCSEVDYVMCNSSKGAKNGAEL